MSTDESLTPPPEPKLGYITSPRGTIYKVKGAKTEAQKTADEQHDETLRQQGFMALRIGFSQRRHRERLEAERQQALDTIRQARQVSGQVIAQVGDTAVEMTPEQAAALEQHLERTGEKLRRLMPDQQTKDIINDASNDQPS